LRDALARRLRFTAMADDGRRPAGLPGRSSSSAPKDGV